MVEKPRRLTSLEWEERMKDIPEEYIKKCTFLRDIVPGGVRYLFSPYEYSCRGDNLLNRLKFDNSLAALRLWSFVFSEKDRLFLAREKGWKIFAAMKDLGQVPIITYAVPQSLTFYADELWWAPCFAEETHLLDEAAKLGASDELCYIRAALGAYKTLDYFPKPDLSFAGVGACCDDFSAVMQLIEWQGNPIHWWEIPARFEKKAHLSSCKFQTSTFGKSDYQQSAYDFLLTQYQGIVKKLEDLTGQSISENDLQQSVKNFNQIRKRVREIRDLMYSTPLPPMPSIEAYLVEFFALHYCSEPLESILVLDDVLALLKQRANDGLSMFEDEPIRIFCVTPPTDTAIISLLNDLGAAITGTEYLISHSFIALDEEKPALQAIAENYMDDPMIGSSRFRAQRIVNEARKYRAEGVLITGIFGASHCAYEERVISEEVKKELNIPVLSFDVPYSPGRLSEQVVTRVQGFVELLRGRRGIKISAGSPHMQQTQDSRPLDPFDYFKNSMAHETDWCREQKRKGKGIVGIYCEFTPRDLILAADAIPVCLCGTNQSTIAVAETVLPANLCPLIKSSYGYILSNRCPFYVISDLIVAETTCDGKKKMFEFIAEKKDTHILELTQKVDEKQAFEHWYLEIIALKEALENKFDITITDERLHQSIKAMNQERALILKAQNLGMHKPSIVSGKELALLRYRTAGNENHQKMIKKFIEKIEARAATGYIFGTKNAPRVLLTGCPTGQGTEKVIKIVEECGGVVVVQEACSGIKPLYENIDESSDPLKALAIKYFNLPCSCMTPNKERVKLLGTLIKDFQVDVVIDLVWQACHTYNVESFFIDKYVRGKLGIPFLKIETDYSLHDHEQLRVRIQTLLEIA